MNRFFYYIILIFYNIVIGLVFLLLLPFKFFYFIKYFKKIYDLKRKKNIWIHCSSVGEANIVINILQNINNIDCYSFVITVVTKNGKKVLVNVFKNYSNVLVLNLFFDFYFISKLFVYLINPLFVIWVESDFWLNYLQILKNKKIKTILINARISNSSYLRWKKIKFLLKEVLNVFSSIYPSSNCNLIKYKEFYNDNLECIGNLKYVFREKLDIKLESINLKLQSIKQNDFIIFGLSTHFGEEVILLENFLKLKEIYSNLKLIILPRHIDRCDNLVLDLKKIYKNIHLVDLMQPFNVINLGDVLIVKNIGIVSYLCKISNIVYVGRSLSVKKRGGQNIVEPMGLGKFVIVGKNMENFLDIVDEIMLEKNLGFVMLNHKNELFDVIKSYYLLDDLKKNHYKINNINYIKNKQFILDKYLSIIESIMLENGKTC